MIRLLALAPEDGWAFVRSEGQVRLLRPPYGKRTHPVVEESAVARAVAVEGFEAAEEDFADWADLFAALEQRFLASRPAPPAGLAPEAVERILRHAPPSALDGFLDRIECELLPSRQWEPALVLLDRFLAVESPAAVALRPRAVGLQGRCAAEVVGALEKLQRWAAATGAGTSFAAAARRYGGPELRERARHIRQRSGFLVP
jgi:hypothetical protein